MPASEICSSWTFGTLRADEAGLKPMPIEGSAQRAQAMSWWGKQSLAIKITIGLTLTTVLLLVIILPIVISIGNSNDDAATTTSPLTFRQLAYTCTDSAQTPSYSAFLGVSGSSYHVKPTWEGTIYTQDVDGSGTGGCVTEFSTYQNTWAPVTQNSSSVPVMPSGVTATPTLWLGPEGYYYLRINGCIAYYKETDNANAYWNGIGAVWPVVEPDGSVQPAAPVCA